MTRLAIFFFVGCAFAWIAHVQGELSKVHSSRLDHSLFDQVLSGNVRDDGTVDYLQIRKAHWTTLNRYLDQLAAEDLENLPRDEKLAAYLNLYNATMIHTVIGRLKIDWSPKQDRFAVFKEPQVRLSGKSVSLDELEHQMIRPGFGEPRIHAALVCAAIACPKLSEKAFRAENLEQRLEDAMRAWINDEPRGQIDDESKTIYVSSLFRSYAADFGGIDKIPAYIASHHKKDVAAYEVKYLTYDWTLNLAKPTAGRWARVLNADVKLYAAPQIEAETAGTVSRNEVFEVLEEVKGWYRIDRAMGQGEAWIESADACYFTTAR